VIVNPNQPGCGFASKSIAGVGVMFYVLLALRSRTARKRCFRPQTQPKLDALLPLVALGTVADVVRSTPTTAAWWPRASSGCAPVAMPVGMASLFTRPGAATVATTFDFGFALGPRINAAGRLSDMTLGIECLLTDDPARGDELARTLDGINRERRVIEGDMRDAGHAGCRVTVRRRRRAAAGDLRVRPGLSRRRGGHRGLAHQGQAAPPDLCVCGQPGAGQGRTNSRVRAGRLPGFHLRDALDLVAKRHPGVLLRFGGHAMAAGCTIDAGASGAVRTGAGTVALEWLDAATLTRRMETDGPLDAKYRRVDLVDTLHQEVWGQGFAPPTFSEEVEVLSQRLVGEKHLASSSNTRVRRSTASGSAGCTPTAPMP
jgi:single-stranded-DNA-specific exonuclease